MKLFCHPARSEAKMRDLTANFACGVRSRIQLIVASQNQKVRDDREKVRL